MTPLRLGYRYLDSAGCILYTVAYCPVDNKMLVVWRNPSYEALNNMWVSVEGSPQLKEIGKIADEYYGVGLQVSVVPAGVSPSNDSENGGTGPDTVSEFHIYP